MKIGATANPPPSWVAGIGSPEWSRAHCLADLRHLVEEYSLSAVELTLDAGLMFPHVFNEEFYVAVADLQQELGFVCTAHLPAAWVDPASPYKPVRRASVDCLRQAAELTDPLEVLTYVLHLWGYTIIRICAAQDYDPPLRQAILSEAWAQAGKSLDEMGECLDLQDLCVETLETPPFEEVWPSVERYGVGICLDVGHLAHQGGGELEYLARHGKRIREVHLHDAMSVTRQGRTETRDHQALGQGEIDYLAFLRELENTGYEGAVILEVGSKADLEASLAQVGMFL